ncbi:type II toxin-antitoxin system RelE/ParE family toxin [Candidatus Uhrbacteria bacterium]|nr:type II toxin-antitoxin system RelE/ParE family toxin [Candidatus Uhrbacteria bacterium]
MEVQFFDNKVKEFIKTLEIPTSAKVFRTLELLERFGHALGMPHSKHIGGGLLELRVKGTQEVRLIYAFHKGVVVLLHGFIKKSQKIPHKEIVAARQKLSTLDTI